MENMQSLILELHQCEVGVIAVGTTPEAYNREKHFCSSTENIKVSLGLHPQLASERKQDIGLFLGLITGCKYIGEIGLDFNTSFIESKTQQLLCFRKIIKACSKEGRKVLSIHSVKATGTVIDELEKAGTVQNNICILHWFSGTAMELKRAIEAGIWFSINPRMLKTQLGQKTIKTVPADRLLLETDAPFAITIKSADILKEELERLLNGIVEIRGEEVKKQIERNSEKVFMSC